MLLYHQNRTGAASASPRIPPLLPPEQIFRTKHNKQIETIQSINDGIDKKKYSVKYTNTEETIEIIMHLHENGDRTFMCKVDVKSAFRPICLAEDQFALMCMEIEIDFDKHKHDLPPWLKGEGKEKITFFDSRAPFGARSAPFIFETLAQAIRKITKNVFGIELSSSYLDDTLILATSADTADRDLRVFIATLEILGMHVNRKKSSTSSAEICTFLGIELDSIKQEARMPQARMVKLDALMKEWVKRETCTRLELEKLAGVLHHFAKCIPSGRHFLRRLLDTLHDKHWGKNIAPLLGDTEGDISWVRAGAPPTRPDTGDSDR